VHCADLRGDIGVGGRPRPIARGGFCLDAQAGLGDLFDLLLAGFVSFALGCLGVHHGLELGTGHELGHGGGWDFQGCAGGGVLARASGALGGFKGTKAHELDGVALFDGGLDGINEGLQYRCGRNFGEVVLGGQDFNEISAVHSL
jgi:hypothetical protein